MAEGKPSGLLLTMLRALAAGVIGLALRRLDASLTVCLGGSYSRYPAYFRHFLALLFRLPVAFGHSLPGAVTVTLARFTSAAVMHATLGSGLSHWHVLRLILLPQAWPNLLPSWTGLLTSLIKDTSLAFIVNVPELTTVVSQVNSRLQIYPAEIFLLVGALYYVLCASLTALAAWSGRSAGLRRGGERCTGA